MLTWLSWLLICNEYGDDAKSKSRLATQLEADGLYAMRDYIEYQINKLIAFPQASYNSAFYVKTSRKACDILSNELTYANTTKIKKMIGED